MWVVLHGIEQLEAVAPEKRLYMKGSIFNYSGSYAFKVTVAVSEAAQNGCKLYKSFSDLVTKSLSHSE